MDLWSSLYNIEQQANSAKDARIMKYLVIFGIIVIIVAIIEAVGKKSK